MPRRTKFCVLCEQDSQRKRDMEEQEHKNVMFKHVALKSLIYELTVVFLG